MNVVFVGKKVTLTEDFKQKAEKKLQKIEKLIQEPAVNIVVSTVREQATVELTIKSGGFMFRAEKTALDKMDALEEGVDTIIRQIRKNKTRLEKAKKVDPNIDFPDALYDEPDEEIHVVRTKSFYVKVMTPEEAILQMNMLGHQFFMFRDDSTGEINVVYRRKDGDYGLLVPESK